MSWSVGQRTRDKGRAGSAREEGARAGGEAQSGRAGRAGWSPDQRPQPQPYQPAGWPNQPNLFFDIAEQIYTGPGLRNFCCQLF